MTQVRTIKVAAVSAMVGAVLILGAFLVTYSRAGAQTPPPTETPSADEPATPRQTPRAPGDDSDGSGQRSREDCPKEDGANGESSSTTGVRSGAGMRGFRQ